MVTTTDQAHQAGTTRMFSGGPGNRADRARLASLTEDERQFASDWARTLRDGARDADTCWRLALDETERLAS